MALSFAGALALAAGACLLHAVFPFAFERTGSRAVETGYRRMVTHRARTAASPGGPPSTCRYAQRLIRPASTGPSARRPAPDRGGTAQLLG